MARLATLAAVTGRGHVAAVLKASDIDWRVSDGLVSYEEALAFMEERAAAVRAGSARDCVWLLEHPPLFTAGTSADPAELFNPNGFPVFEAGRGGRYTYHGPGQRVVYLILDLDKRGRDVRCLVHSLEGWIIAALGDLGVEAHRAEGRIGIWVGEGLAEKKIAALGIRVKRWVTLHGIAINVNPQLAHFGGIIPCGISGYGVTSLSDLGKDARMSDVDDALHANFDGFLSALAASCKVT